MTALRVRQVMTEDPQLVYENEHLPLADLRMKLLQFRHFPVVDSNENLVGILSQRDILRSQMSDQTDLSTDEKERFEDKILIRDVMTKDARTVGPDELAVVAASTLKAYRIGCLPVVQNGKVVGILTASDFLDWVIQELSDPGR